MSTGFTFQGDYRRRSQINLGGHKREDRATLLRKAQEERRAREEKRRNDLAAMKIQVLRCRAVNLIFRPFGEVEGISLPKRMC